MDYAPSSSTAAGGSYVTPIPRLSHHRSDRKSFRVDARNGDDDSRTHLSPASPEVISSLITSLSVISQPANNLFDKQPLTLPISPGQGSFGVDYGAYRSPSLRVRDEEVSLDELAASPPTIRTAPPPSGLSPLTAPKSPRSPRRESSGGLRSLLRSSRPSSRSSASSSQDETRSIGNLSIERGLPTPELHRKGSHDSWGKKANRNSKGLMYMSSKERLRASEAERKRSSFGAAGTGFDYFGGALSPRQDPSLVDTSISEEPANLDLATRDKFPERSSSLDQNQQRPIPVRDSSLRKTGSNAKRPSHRSTKSKRDSDTGVNESIPENEENDRSYTMSVSARRQPVRSVSEADTTRAKDDMMRSEARNSSRLSTASQDAKNIYGATEDIDDGAPYPAVASSRRRSTRSEERRKSGRTTPEPGDILRMKRSSSGLKRLSAGLKSPDEEKSAPSEPGAGHDRPLSTDSIDDAVQSYLCSPRLSQKIKHPQTGRTISFSEVGDSEGSAVFCCVGMGLTRYIMAFYDELALTLKLRLITPDRPGVGDSEPYADGTATPLSWPDDVYAICQALKITKFSILAHSAGAIYALATALRMPQHIRGRIHLLAPWIPPSQMNVFGTSQVTPPANAIPTSQRILRALPTPFLKAANSSFMTATSSSITSSLPKDKKRNKKRSSAATSGRRDVTPTPDKENISHDSSEDGGKTAPLPTENMDQIRPQGSDFDRSSSAVISTATDALVNKERQMTYDTRLTYAIWDLATTGANPAVDLLVCLERRHTIGFRYVDITRPIVIHHGSKDNRVPVDNVRWLGKTMRKCEVRVLEGEGHGLMASATVMGNVLMEISREWEDWNRATGTQRERGRSFRAGVR